MGIFDTFKILFMSDDDQAELARNRNAAKGILIKLCKYGNVKVLEAIATNPNTPKEVLIGKLIEIITDKKRNVRESAIEVIKKLRGKQQTNLELSFRLTQLLEKSDWIRSSEIVQALGILRSRIATATICSLIHIATREAAAYKEPQFEFGEDYCTIKQWKMKTDTDEGEVSAEAVYRRFISHSIKALGDIGDPDAVDDLKSIIKNEYIKQDKGLKGAADSVLKKLQEGKKSTAHKKIQEK